MRIYIITCVIFLFLTAGCKKNPVETAKLPLVLYGSVTDSVGNPIENVDVHYIFEFPGSSPSIIGGLALPLNKIAKTCPSTPVEFEVPSKSKVTIRIFRWYTHDTIGTLIDDTLESGTYSSLLDSLNITNGFYIAQITVDTSVQERTIFLLDNVLSSLITKNPLTKTNSNGLFELPYDLLGFGVPVTYVVNDSVRYTLEILPTIHIVLHKAGYTTLNQSVTINTRNGTRQTFILNRE